MQEFGLSPRHELDGHRLRDDVSRRNRCGKAYGAPRIGAVRMSVEPILADRREILEVLPHVRTLYAADNGQRRRHVVPAFQHDATPEVAGDPAIDHTIFDQHTEATLITRVRGSRSGWPNV